jgi:hypothetical protein
MDTGLKWTEEGAEGDFGGCYPLADRIWKDIVAVGERLLGQ